MAKRLIELVEENDMNDEQFIALFRHIELLTPVSVIIHVKIALLIISIAWSPLYW
jgi:hypothetical protein